MNNGKGVKQGERQWGGASPEGTEPEGRHITLKFPDEGPQGPRNPLPDTDPIMAVRDVSVRTPLYLCFLVLMCRGG